MARINKILMLTAMLALSQNAYAVNFASSADLILESSSLSPEAGTQFSVEARSFAFDPLRANFRWFSGGKLIASGRGLRAQTFTASGLGSIMNISVTAVAEDGQSYTTRLSLPINDIDLIVRPRTYIPNFYRGSPLPTPGSIVEIIALPHIFNNRAEVRVPASSLIYEWRVDNSVLENESGGGKNKLLLSLADVSENNYLVSVKISLLNGEVAAEKSVRIKTVNPEILFYKTSPLTGIRPFAFSNLPVSAGEKISIAAEPYFFDLASLAKAAFLWLADGAPLKNVKNPHILELETPAGSDSEGAFNLKIEDKKTIFQNAEASLSITSSL